MSDIPPEAPAPAPSPPPKTTEDERTAPPASLIPPEAPPARPLDDRPLLTVRQPERMGRVGVRAVASGLVVIVIGAVVTALGALAEAVSRGGMPNETLDELPFAASATSAFAMATLVFLVLEGVAHLGWNARVARVVLFLVAGLVAPIAGVLTYQIAVTGVVPMTQPGMAFVLLGEIVTPLAKPLGAALALMPTVSLACLAAARSPVHRHPGEYGVVDGTWLAAKWGTPAALPIVLILGIREPVGAIITLLFLVPLIAGTTWTVGVALSFVDMLGVIAADAVTPQERAFRRGDVTLD